MGYSHGDSDINMFVTNRVDNFKIATLFNTTVGPVRLDVYGLYGVGLSGSERCISKQGFLIAILYTRVSA